MKRLLSFILLLMAASAFSKPRDPIAVDVCGAITQRTGTQTDTPFLFNGAYGVMTDPNGLLYMQARFYNPSIRRFTNSDPSGFAGGHPVSMPREWTVQHGSNEGCQARHGALGRMVIEFCSFGACFSLLRLFPRAQVSGSYRLCPGYQLLFEHHFCV